MGSSKNTESVYSVTMHPGERGQIVFHLENGKSVSERQLTRARSFLSLFPLDYAFGYETYQKVDVLSGKRVKAISYYHSRKIYTLSATELGNANEYKFIFKENLNSKAVPKSQILGILLDDMAILKTISFADASETTRIIIRR